ncbi:methyl-accepting chemotaxis protein [Clostridium sp. AWRP]|uniref:methyl-accepting chemotaxis protein n=1 Tax=Clostridium sp. AWRP TaxID=2212991 RepID=UPI000FD760A7|nr:methyl-accepting chemotaxis protein [Clostridium sp. AWRP]AZV57059.1 chemotaxis protein [Clostridium sp. AWRP]
MKKEEIINAFLKVVPVLKDMLLDDIAVSVADTTKVLYYRAGDTLDIKVNVGDKLSPGEPLYEAIKDGKTYSSTISKEFYGVPFKGVSYPIKDSDGNVIGGVGIGKSLSNEIKVEEASENLFASLEETSASIEEISAGSEKLLNVITNILEITKQAKKQIEESNQIIAMITNLASKSNLLGLNASIEAARSGEYGKGFSVVANEIRKLAQLSNQSSEKVSQSLSETNKYIRNIFKVISDAQSISEGQAASTQEMTATLEEITASAQTLTEISKTK